MTRVTLLCHGATAATRAAAFPADEPLEPQALAKLASLPKPVAVGRCVTSPALRAMQTAQALGLDAVPEPLLRDCDYGRWAGVSMAAIQAAAPEGFAAWLEQPEAAPHGGESLADLTLRVGAWLASCAADDGHVIAVTHAAVIRAAVAAVLGAPPHSFWRIDVAPLSTTRLSSANGRWTLAALNAFGGV